ncbi:MAG: glutaminase, partial [Myxococcota bacterium]
MSTQITRLEPVVDERELRLFRAMDLYNRGFVDTSDLFQAQQETGLSQHDFRLKESLRVLMKLGNRTLDFDAFRSVIRPAILLVEQVLQGQMVVPDFTRLTQPIDDIYGRVQQMRSGEVASYISQLARVPPEQFGVSLCTIDGQIKSWGDADVDFCLQSTCKPINYCLALEEQGEEKVHQHVGREPSGVSFNELTLAENNRPHNPMINAGAIMCCSLIRPDADMSERFDYVLDRWAALCGGNRPRYNNAVYLSERATADRNFALGYFMKEKKAFPEGTNLIDTLEFYFQCCAIEFNCKDMALVAATLANGGVCPASGMRVLKSQTVQNALSLMYSCG